jgi:hypothetical protein
MNPACTSAPQAGTIITRTGVKSLADAAPESYPLMGWCQPCGLPLVRRVPGGEWEHRGASAFWSVRQAGHRWDWDTYGIADAADLAGPLICARAEARAQSAGDAHGLPWVVELTEAGTRSEWARYCGGEITERPRKGARQR